jgi:hypothetical protein
VEVGTTVEKAESRKLKFGNVNLLVVQVLDPPRGWRSVSVYIDEWLNEITFRASPKDFDKYFPLFLQSLETIEWN